MQLFLSCHAADALPTLARAALEEHFTRPKHGNGPDAAVLLVEACLAELHSEATLPDALDWCCLFLPERELPAALSNTPVAWSASLSVPLP